MLLAVVLELLKKPDILINTHQESLDEIINLQSKLLKVASNL